MGVAPGSKVVMLAGGTGGAKLARGMLDVVGPDELVVIANTGDDIDIYGAHVSPDPDLVSFWLADEIDERGWGLRDDTFAVMDALRALGHDVWFNLGDRDLAWCLERRRLIEQGLRPTEALARLNEAIGVRVPVLPMSDEPQPTWVRTDAGWRDFQHFMIRERAEGRVREVAFGPNPDADPAAPDRRAAAARPTPEALAALAGARAVIVGPSNPVISIWPILSALGGALADQAAPVVCVSPIVGGAVVKGPTAAFLAAYEQPPSAGGVAAFYERVAPGLLDGIVADEPVAEVTSRELDTMMADDGARAWVAEQTLAFAESISPRHDEGVR
ncbi:MAG TPA: 2-phospho-L-lactate transferase CofD family protein [Solirubrobacteraceae bacterium]|nr:2-phospho-L-lactate transferase CofD family protein [Solirubrobacteraceae bacterium]